MHLREKQSGPGTVELFSDNEFLRAIGVRPFDTQAHSRPGDDTLRTRVLGALAILQFLLLIGGIIWPSR